jgi:hypothetical protein
LRAALYGASHFVLWPGSELRQVHKSDIERTTNVSRRHSLLWSIEQDTFIPSLRSFPLSTAIFHCKRGNFPNTLQAHIFERSIPFLI